MRVAILIAALACGCASAEHWHLVKTPNFVLRTDLDAPAALQAGQALEATRDALISAAWPGIDFADLQPTEAYVVANEPLFDAAFGGRIVGTFRADPPTFLLRGGPERWEVHPADQR